MLTENPEIRRLNLFGSRSHGCETIQTIPFVDSAGRSTRDVSSVTGAWWRPMIARCNNDATLFVTGHRREDAYIASHQHRRHAAQTQREAKHRRYHTAAAAWMRELRGVSSERPECADDG
ncbi:hypothetical protein QAD02_003732 [Eretmocerus hayati]|uniref:Uncharacterized protein n=1 Tax=Eretmocerus hayati TaxID=131215 RepID=A0ACC2NMP3_9HYME|nr:hypothetical protein QAD02_003732 [Eretmocerus hayati]